MAISTRITIDDARLVESYRYDSDSDAVLHVFVATVDPDELRRRFQPPRPNQIEAVSVLNVMGHAHGGDTVEDVTSLSIDPEAAELVVLGTEPILLVCEAFDNSEELARTRQRPGDKQFLTDLPPDLKALGRALIREIRAEYRGELLFNKRVQRYVETPDQWFTIKPQRRTINFAITVRGRPDSFHRIAGNNLNVTQDHDRRGKPVVAIEMVPRSMGARVELKPDGGNSSRFVLDREEQLASVMQIFRNVSASTRNRWP